MRVAFPSRARRLRRVRSRIALLAALGVLTSGSGFALAGPQSSLPVRAVERAPSLQDLIAEASRRFGVPASWIVEVMSVESRGRANALSPKGAIGLMQVMPATYAEMRARYGLGANPWEPRDNVLAGTAYLRLLYDRYGAPGFLVAYNAGPGRWDDYRLRARPLPAETVAYLARLGPIVSGSMLPMPTFAGWAAPGSSLAAPIFVRPASAATPARLSADRERIVRLMDANTSIVRPTDAIFVARPDAAEVQSGARFGVDASAERVPTPPSPGVPEARRSAPGNWLFPERTSGRLQP